MSHLDFKFYPGLGEWMARDFHFSQSVAIPAGGTSVHLSGQTGCDPTISDRFVFREGIEAQVKQTFANIELALKDCGATLDNVVEITTYVVELDQAAQMAIIQTLHSVFPNHRPLWTAVGVKALAAPEALIEIRAMAHIPAPSSS